ncbi:MAG: toll/interleukin-1 receptor domain-containing protein [Hyphomonadaceae bacterium]|nr:toll/interleukin-1 receptor domain-containing protein [Hyphomonadaceae bacterium]
MPGKIFVSHAVADRKLAKAFVAFLHETFGVPADDVFCSSLPDNGIPLTEDFNTYIKDEIKGPALVIILMTEAYLERHFCLMELGAAWATDAKALAIVVPPVPFATVTNTLGLKQAWDITDYSGHNKLRTLLHAAITPEKRGADTWDEKRKAWKAALPALLKKLPGATKVDKAVHQSALTRVETLEAQVADLEGQLERAEERNTKLEKLKDAEAVKALNKDMGDTSAEDTFEQLLEDVRDARPDKISDRVFLHMVLDHYGKAGSIDRDDYEEFQRAGQYNLFDSDGEPTWGGKLAPLARALRALDKFLVSFDGAAFAETQGDTPMDSDDREFWEHHLNL